AKLTREVAEVAVTEYKEGIYKQDMQTVLGEIKLATSELTRAIDRIEWASRMHDKGYVSEAQVAAEDAAFQKTVFALEQAMSKRTVLQKYTKDKTIKELRSEVEKARSSELTKMATWELKKSNTDHLARDVARCKMAAPVDGELILAPGIEKGATVREHQLIFRVLTETLANPAR